MALAALTTWLVTAMGGLYLLITWLVRGGLRQQRARLTNFPAPLILGHFLLAATGLGTWIVFALIGSRSLAWAAFSMLLAAVLLGFTMFARWGAPIQQHAAGTAARPLGDARGTPAAGGTLPGQRGRIAVATSTEPESPAESHFPIVVVAAHGAFAATTLILVLLTALSIGVV